MNKKKEEKKKRKDEKKKKERKKRYENGMMMTDDGHDDKQIRSISEKIKAQLQTEENSTSSWLTWLAQNLLPVSRLLKAINLLKRRSL